MQNPEITILLGTYNRAHLIPETLVSITAQTYEHWECLIVDDGSVDNTEEVVKGFIERDSRFKYLKRPDKHRKGLPGCRNYGLDLSIGKYIIFFDDDDIAHPQNLEVCLKILKDTDADFCHYRKESFTNELPDVYGINLPVSKFSIGLEEIEKVITNKIALASCTVMWRKECFGYERFMESLDYAEEWECYTRILMKGFKGVGIHEVLYFNKKHANSNTGEFWQGDKDRRLSYKKAIKLVIDNLQHEKLLSKRLIRYFVQLSIFLKDRSILEYVLSESDSRFDSKLRYRLLYKFYPVLVVGHRTKKILKKKF